MVKEQVHQEDVRGTVRLRDDRLRPVTVEHLAAIPASRRILVPRDVSLAQAGECAYQLLRLGSDSMETLLVYPHAGPAAFNGVMAICDALGLCSAPTIGLAMGFLTNGGCLILQACTTRVMSRFTQIQLGDHSSHISLVFGPRENLVDVYESRVHPDVEDMQRRQEQTMKALVARSKLSPEEVSRLMKEDATLTAEQALQLGLVDDVI